MVCGLNAFQTGFFSNELLLKWCRGGELLVVELRMEEEALTTAAFSSTGRFSATYLSSCLSFGCLALNEPMFALVSFRPFGLKMIEYFGVLVPVKAGFG